MNVRVVLVDNGCNLDRSVLRAVAEAATIQMHRDFGRPVPYGFGVTATVRVAKDLDDIRKDEWVLEYLPKLKLESGGPLGYHEIAPNGLPRMIVFPFLDDPHMRGLVETHEIIETLADPWTNKTIPDQFGRLVACEPADPVEPSWYPIAVRGGWVPVSNFVTPAYYLPQQYPNVPYDFLGQLRYPGEILPGGFLSTFSPSSGGKWTQQTNGFRRPYRSVQHARSRTNRRARGNIQYT